MKKTRILIIEDNRVLGESFTKMLNEQKDMRVVAYIGSENNILLRTSQTKPDIILMDVSLKNLNVFSVVASLRKQIPQVKLIGMGFVPTPSDIVEFVEAGTSGFILKNATVAEFLESVRLVARGEKVLPPILAGSLFTHVVELGLKKGKRTITNAVRMTKREREIIALIADGLSNKEIAQHLNIATHTVKSHVHNIMEKLALHSRLQIAMQVVDEKKF